MMCPCRSLSITNALLVGDDNNWWGYAWWGEGQSLCKISVVSAQFCCEPKTTLKKNEVHFWKVKLALFLGFPGGSDSKESASSVKDPDSIPGLGWSPGKGNGNWLQYSCLENPMDGGAWQVTVHGVAESWTWLSDFTCCLYFWFLSAFPSLFET